uniref:Uncharacterized protein n=1 Tax=viral metagenome TaxID=1070528 RepID=A0A6C0C6K4_9ZZZZ
MNNKKRTIMKRQLASDSYTDRPVKRFMSDNTKGNVIIIADDSEDEIILFADKSVNLREPFRSSEERRMISESDNDDLVITINNIVPTKRTFSKEIVRRKQDPKIINFDKIGDSYIFNSPLYDIPNVTIDCRNVFHYDGKYVPKRGGEMITVHNAVDVAQETMLLIRSIPQSCGTFCVLSDLLGPAIVDIIARELYKSCKKLSRRIIVISYTGNKPNGDDIRATELNMPIITNDQMNKYNDVYFSEHDSHDFRFIAPPIDFQRKKIYIPHVNKCSIKSY